jgi:hypothetical protein
VFVLILVLTRAVIVRRGSSSIVKKAEIQATGELVAVKVYSFRIFVKLDSHLGFILE